MTSDSTLLFTVILRHLSSDGKKAGADVPNAELYYMSVKQLRALLESANAVAPTVEYPAEPELRITGSTGKFVVRVKGGQLHLVSWSSAHKGGVVTPAQVIEAVGGGDKAEDAGSSTSKSRAPMKTPAKAAAAKGGSGSDWREKLTLVALGIAIVGVNCFTVWFVTRPPRSLTGEYRLLPAEEAQQVLQDVAGAYETGRSSGDRRIEISKDGNVNRLKFGSGGSIKETQNFTVKPAVAAGNKALLTSRKSLMTIKDPTQLTLYGDTYKKVAN
jgi:hypothetical protein